MISAKVLCSNHPEEATLPLRCLATATPLWTCRPGTIAGAIILGQQLYIPPLDRAEKYRSFFIAPRKEVQTKCQYPI